MKTKFLLIGLLLGLAVGFFATNWIQKETAKKTVETPKTAPADSWKWPENMDAMKAAPDNHKIVYEDDNVRVLAVMLEGKKSEPIHTHRWKSVMWISKSIVPCQINNYKKDAAGDLVKTDSVTINEMPVEVGQLLDAEGPTSITNLGSENGLAYRVEFKKEFAK